MEEVGREGWFPLSSTKLYHSSLKQKNKKQKHKICLKITAEISVKLFFTTSNI